MKYLGFLVVFFSFCCAHGYADTYPEVVFDNSLVKGSYAKSRVQYAGASWVENVNGHLLVSDTLFFTPGNALSLRYLSNNQGHWDVSLRYSRQKYLYRFSDKDFLSIRMYVKTENTELSDLPRLYISQRNKTSDTLNIRSYIEDFEVGKWVQVKVPAKDFKIDNVEEPISGVHFIQHNASDEMHHVFIDQVEFLPAKYSEVKLSTNAVLTEAVGYDRIVHLKWQLPLTPSIRYIKIYRSEDGQVFRPIGIRPVQMQSCLDIVPVVGQKYFYKITWMDFNYEESLFSSVKEASTKKMENDALITLIQMTHINYFVENFDINSGMYLPYRSKDKAVVSTKETAPAVLALLIGVERKFINRQIALNRISKMTYFLLRAQNKYGVFPAYFDGRKGVPEYRRGFSSYDVNGTASLIEALLIARQYFSQDNEIERDLRSRITALYDNVNWQKLVADGTTGVLRSKLSLMEGNSPEDISTTTFLSGPNDAINTYLLAIAARKYPLPASVYYNGVYNNFNINKHEHMEELDTDIYSDSLIHDYTNPVPAPKIAIDTVTKLSIIQPSTQFGVYLPLGEMRGSLIDLYKPFLTIEPKILKDSLMEWSEVLEAYTHYVKRRDNEVGVGTTNSDIWGFYQHKDSIGNYRVNPAIAPSSIIIEPELGIASVLALYTQYGHILFTEYGFRSWLDLRNDDVSDEYLALNQGAIAVMLENAKSGMIWKLYQEIPELQKVRKELFLGQVEDIN
ncbi:glucoamylase family protein [Sphingobacterium tabacisoli]|uniref:Glucoamylase family protein n=1 Tax=Sphingobacterium tabacisoli TaxID=2044855 RepID=A0ABW5L4A0_9SPHI|nr:glucoamylase family protein [Sphingobacterium tabacisoli]